MNQPSAPLPKKRKHSAPTGVNLASKKQRKEHSQTDGEQERKKDKGKGRANSDMDREFEVISASLVVSIAPVFAANPRAGVEEMLDSMVMR
jgi:DNA-directed RNA polymerase I subunit RPA43